MGSSPLAEERWRELPAPDRVGLAQAFLSEVVIEQPDRKQPLPGPSGYRASRLPDQSPRTRSPEGSGHPIARRPGCARRFRPDELWQVVTGLTAPEHPLAVPGRIERAAARPADLLFGLGWPTLMT
jgi:hypothetical protein